MPEDGEHGSHPRGVDHGLAPLERAEHGLQPIRRGVLATPVHEFVLLGAVIGGGDVDRRSDPRGIRDRIIAVERSSGGIVRQPATP
jgi:hypothetical protein